MLSLQCERIETAYQIQYKYCRRRFRAANLMGRIARKKKMLTPSHKLRRLRFAKMYKYWTKEDWERSSGLTKPYLVLLDNVTKCMYAEELVKN